MLKKKLAVAVLGALLFSPAILPPNNFVPASLVYAAEKDAKDWISEGDKFLGEKNYKRALNCYQKAVKLNPNDDNYWAKLGITYCALTNYDKSIECLNKSIELNPKNGSALAGFYTVYVQLKDYDKALEYLDKSFALNQEIANQGLDKGTYYLMIAVTGSAALESGNYVKAAEIYDRVSVLEPQKANSIFLTVLKMSPLNDLLWSYLGKNYEKLEDYSSALNCFNKAIKIKPDNDTYQKQRDALLSKMN